MRLDEYLDTVSEQIRYKKIRSTVVKELENHILDQAEAYEACGAFPEEAIDCAVREMGDPVETGVSLDRIHRPQMSWGIVITIGLISLLSIGLFYTIDVLTPSLTYPWQNHAINVLAGFFLMLLIYRMDYSLLSKLGWKPAAIFLIAMILGLLLLHRPINGAYRRFFFIGNISVSVPEAMLLYIPLFGSALYSFRGDGYKVLLKIAPLILIPCGFLWITPSIITAGILFFSLMCLFLFAVYKDWYHISKKSILGVSVSGLLIMPFIFLGYIYLFGEDYQVDRLQAFFSPSGLHDYIVNIAENMRIGSSLIGTSENSVQYLTNGPTTYFLTDYILVSMCSIYGIFLTIAIVAGLLMIVMKIFHISVTQKNQLGMIIGTGCGIAFLVKMASSILINLQIIPYFSISMPFLSYGGSNTFVSYILLGLVLSVYRYKNILPNESKIHKTKRRLRVSVHWETYN